MSFAKRASNVVKDMLQLEVLDRNLFRSVNLWVPSSSPAVYGGQVVGQALMAARMSQESPLSLHSMHAYFLRPGRIERPILYYVEVSRNGRSFATRKVNAVQNGENILTLMASYHSKEKSPVQHQREMPNVKSPEQLKDVDELLKDHVENTILSKHLQKCLKEKHDREVPNYVIAKPVCQELNTSNIKEPINRYWVKIDDTIGDEGHIHKCAAAYLSDWFLPFVGLEPFPNFEVKMIASLDHSIWFHTSDIKADDWLLYECESTRSGGARLYANGRLWSRDGTLVMSTAQEAIARGEDHSES